MEHEIIDAPVERKGALTDRFLSDAQVKYYREQAIAVGRSDAQAKRPRHVPDKLYGHGQVEEGYYVGYDQAATRIINDLATVEAEAIEEAHRQRLGVALMGKTVAWE